MQIQRVLQLFRLGIKGCGNIVKRNMGAVKKIEKLNDEHLHTTEETLVNKRPDSDADSNEYKKQDFLIVGIGASAGGLVALEAFFSVLPTNTSLSMAFVLVQHLDPNHKSLFTNLIGRYTQMRVYEVTDGMIVQPESVYVIPPNYEMVLEDGRLHLHKPVAAYGFCLPIDLFFRSLAQEQQDKAIGIVFSGTDSDGTLGMRAIKAEGGMLMVQSPESSEYDSMPQSAIAPGLVDFILPPAEMPAQLIAYINQAFEKKPIITSKTEGVMK